MPIVFTAKEIEILQGSPQALRDAANYHDAQESEADSIGEPFEPCVERHRARRKELTAEADRLEKE